MNVSFPQSTSVRIVIVLSLIICDSLIFILPYYVSGYVAPVGWDTAWYVCSMRVIAEQGLPAFFEKTGQLNLYIIFGYFISSVFHVSFMFTEKILPIILGVSFSLVNFQIVKKFSKSWRLSLLAMGLSIIDFNIIRMVLDLHRNLFSFILIEIALFLVLPDLLEKVSKRKFCLFVVLLVLAGLSQMETFALVMLALSFLLVFYRWQRLFKRVKLLLFCIVVPCLLVILFESPFLLAFLGEHIVFNPSIKFSYENFVTQPWRYIVSLGSALIPFYVVGLHTSISTHVRNQKGQMPFIIPLWNLVVIACSFIPWLGIKIPGYRFLLLATVPLVSTIGFAKLFAEKSLKMKKVLILITLIVLTITIQIIISSINYRSWISNSQFEKLTWIGNHKQNEPCIFVLYFDKAEWTQGGALLYRNWVWAVIDSRTNVYFGEVKYLLDSMPTPSENPYVNKTSHDFWNELEDFTLNGTLIYLIEDWYNTTAFGQNYIEEVDHEGIYQVETSYP